MRWNVQDHYDVWGNPFDGYTVNDSRQRGVVDTPDDPTDLEILKTLYRAGLISEIGEPSDWSVDGDDIMLMIDGPSADDPNYLIPYFTLYRTSS